MTTSMFTMPVRACGPISAKASLLLPWMTPELLGS